MTAIDWQVKQKSLNWECCKLAIIELNQSVSMRILLELWGLLNKSKFFYMQNTSEFCIFIKWTKSNDIRREKCRKILSRIFAVAWRFCFSKNVARNGNNPDKLRQHRQFNSETMQSTSSRFNTFCFRITISAQVEGKKSTVNGLLTRLMISRIAETWQGLGIHFSQF